jgi:sigma-E factor negative regulatory protein RseC
MSSSNVIEHPGIVSKVEGSRVTVTILAQSACHSCHAKGSCSMGGEENKEIELNCPDEQYHNGETVNVIMQQSTGIKAMLLGYLFPFILLILVLVLMVVLTQKEGLSALVAIGSLAVYYLILYLMQGKLSKELTFHIEKI